ncbi:MAG: PEP-CTERM sorting domain-containing protein [Acidobacteria bacterium]|nr:PEP-CTERM sorting domain-containing protein [Acidobacteriota bacterium]
MIPSFKLIALGMVTLASVALATPITPLYGFGGVTINSLPTVSFAQNTKTGNAFSYNPLAAGDAFGAASLAKNGFIWSVSWDVDPVLTWSFTTTKSGPQTLKFNINILADQYGYIFTSAGYTITGDVRGKGATVTNVVEKAYLPWPDLAGNEVPVGQTTVKGSTGIKGSKTVSNDNTNSGGVGDYVIMPIKNVVSMGVVISFNATLGANDRLGLNGQLDIQPVPEPATFGLLGMALTTFALFTARRRG